MNTFKIISMQCLLLAMCIVANADEIPSNEIWYSSSDGKIINLERQNAFDIRILSNTYSNGKGVIKFNGDVTNIGDYAFQFVQNLTSIIIPNSVTNIGGAAFAYCYSLSSITIPNSVTKIGVGAFSSCYNLLSVSIPDSLTEICSYTFDNCTSLSSIIIPNSVTKIGDYAFQHCNGLTSIKLSDSVISIGSNAFKYCSSLTKFTIPNYVKSIGTYAFYHCRCLTSIAIPSSVEDIASKAFYGCKFSVSEFINNSSLDEISNKYWGAEIYDVVQDDGLCIKDSIALSFRGISTSITIPNYVKSIGNKAFDQCFILESIRIPNSVTSIGASAFNSCSRLKSVIIPNSVTSIGISAFYDCKFTIDEFINESALDEVFSDYWGAKIYDVIQEDGVCIKDNVALSYRGLITSIKIPNTVKSIGESAFSNCSYLASVVIPDSVTSIGGYAFYGCKSLTSITIPKSVKAIGNKAFYGCNGLNSIMVQWERPLSITNDVFEGVDKSNCILYVPKGMSLLYIVAPTWIDFVNIQEYGDGEEECVIDVKQGEGGSVKNVVELGKTYQYIISSVDGWSINSVSFNGADVTNLLSEGRYTTPVITGNSELNVVFVKGGNGVNNIDSSNVKVLASNGALAISGNKQNESVSVYSVGGAEIATDSGNCRIILEAGVYIVKVGNEVFKVSI